MKRFYLCGVAALLSLALMAGCEERPASSSSSESGSSQSSSEVSKAPTPLTDSQAASMNASLTGSDIDLVQLDEPQDGAQIAVIRTTMGDIELILFPEQAPKTVENFVAHAKNGYYNGLTFDKVLRNFIVEGGDPDGKGGESAFPATGGKPGYIDNEFSLDLWHFRGAVSMSGVDGEDGNGSRFFIVQAPFVDAETLEAMQKINYPGKVLKMYEEMGGIPGFDAKRTVFGMVTDESMDVVDAIVRAAVDDKGVPEETILIESVDVMTLTLDEEDGGEDEQEEEDAEESSSKAS